MLWLLTLLFCGLVAFAALSAFRRDSRKHRTAIKVIQRGRRFVIWTQCIMGGAYATLVVFSIPGSGLLGFLILWGLCIAAPVGVNILERNLAKRAAANDYLLCLSCCYDLRGLPEIGRCPECGEPYEAPLVRNEWRTFVPLRPW